MKNLKTLVAMQIKDKINLSFLKSRKQTIFKIVTSILKFVLITALIYVAFFLIDFLNIVEPNKIPGLPQSLFVFVFSIMFALSVIFCTFGLVKSLYISKDNAMLLVMPVGRTLVFISKIVVYYLYELIRNITYYLPLFLVYGLINSMPIYYYLWLIIIYFIVTLVPVALGALLSIPLLFLTNFIKQSKILEIITTTIIGGGLITLIILLIVSIPENIDLIGTWGTTVWSIHNFLNNFVGAFYALALMFYSVTGIRQGVVNVMFSWQQIVGIFGCLALIVVILGITFLLVRPLFFKMASSPFEYKKVTVNKKYINKKHSSFFAGVKKELTLTLRTQEKRNGILIILIGLPIAILLLNKIYAAMDTRLAGLNMAVAFNILIILLFSLSSNCNLAHIYSEEGSSSYLIKTSPKPYLHSLFAKLVVNIFFVTIANIIAVSIFSAFSKYSVITGILIFLVVEGIYLSHLLMSAEYDIMNPQTSHYHTSGGHINNPNDLKSSLMSMVISAIFAFLTYFFIAEDASVAWVKILIFVVGFLALRIWFYINKIKVYYKEKGWWKNLVSF